MGETTLSSGRETELRLQGYMWDVSSSRNSSHRPYFVPASPLLLYSWTSLELKLPISLLWGTMWGSQIKTNMKILCSHVFQMFLFDLWQRRSEVSVRCFHVGTYSCLMPWPLTQAGWGSRGRYYLCEPRVQISCYRINSVSFWVSSCFLTLWGANQKFTWRSSSLAIGRDPEVSAELSRPDVSRFWAEFSAFPLCPSSPLPSSFSLVLPAATGDVFPTV